MMLCFTTLYYFYLERRDRQINDNREVLKYKKVCTKYSVGSKERMTSCIAGKGWQMNTQKRWCLSYILKSELVFTK